ncbi:non-homologous end-joining DNA ligase [Anaeromyxobacter terrae]|uniref:non-homologous end-joining DNA ligase n=1 Tax=Anaeromyxobacter terrae TaxID=2925406 RepID=UPI001F59177E|nr:non-homologous end-joining DNA ligase [Anaeromyxobacter sp. SG22]
MPDRLDSYRAKRDPGRTPEPFGPAEEGVRALDAPRLFVVQKHAARRLHWDFRLELGGTLRSWAVPKGPSADPADKRMAVEVEDHPVEYAGFEGLIPAGNYGAGAVIVWDRGAWRPVGDPYEGLARGKLVFQLSGYKLHGEWTLVRTRMAQGGKQQWLLLKHRGDAWAGPGRPFAEESVLSGRLLEELAAGEGRAERAVREAERLGAPRRALSRGDARLMRAEPRGAPFDGEGWLFEVKYDGYRLLARREGARATLLTLRGEDATALYPEIARPLETLPVDAIVDGEVVVLGPDGRPDLDALEARSRLARPADVARAAIERPATYFVFDLLALGGLDVRALPLAERKRLLADLVPRLGAVRYADHVEARGEDLQREVRARGLAGVVAKRADAPYRAGRSSAWLDIPVERSDGHAAATHDASPPVPRAARPARPAREVKVTNGEKVWFPADGITKADVVAYYRAIAPFMLPYLKDRPLVLTRYPDGIDGKSFFQKDAPRWRPEWMRTVRIRSEDAGRDLDHFLVDDADGLAWIANLGTIPLHVWSSRAGALERPDWCVVDLDPKEAPFEHVVRIARAVRALCEELGLPSYPKTTGQKGLHVLVPLGGQLTHAQSRTLGELLARAVEAELPEIATTARALPARGERVYLDYLQNGYGKTIAAPYAVRPRPGAPVSTPLRWSEVTARLDSSRFTIRGALGRARRLRSDPLLPVLSGKPDLMAALERLRVRMAASGAGRARKSAREGRTTR